MGAQGTGMTSWMQEMDNSLKEDKSNNVIYASFSGKGKSRAGLATSEEPVDYFVVAGVATDKEPFCEVHTSYIAADSHCRRMLRSSYVLDMCAVPVKIKTTASKEEISSIAKNYVKKGLGYHVTDPNAFKDITIK